MRCLLPSFSKWPALNSFPDNHQLQEVLQLPFSFDLTAGSHQTIALLPAELMVDAYDQFLTVTGSTVNFCAQ